MNFHRPRSSKQVSLAESRVSNLCSDRHGGNAPTNPTHLQESRSLRSWNKSLADPEEHTNVQFCSFSVSRAHEQEKIHAKTTRVYAFINNSLYLSDSNLCTSQSGNVTSIRVVRRYNKHNDEVNSHHQSPLLKQTLHKTRCGGEKHVCFVESFAGPHLRWRLVDRRRSPSSRTWFPHRPPQVWGNNLGR